MRVVVLCNGGAGTALPPERLVEVLREAGIEAEVQAVEGPALREAAVAAVGRTDAVVAAGGDGTVSAVAGALAGTGTPLGVLPLGTLNHFAKDLGIPLDVAGAARVLAEGRVRAVDVAEVNGHRFVNNSSVGFYPRVVTERGRLRAALGKWLGVAWGALAVLWKLPRLRLRLRFEGGEAPFVTPFLFVGNNRYDPRLLADRHRDALDRGELRVYVAPWSGRLAFVRLAVRALLGRRRPFDVTELSARAVQVHSRRRSLRVAADGEVLRLAPPLRYAIHPGALRVLAPAEPG